MGLTHQLVIMCIYIWGFALVCSLCFSLCVISHINPSPGFFICLFVGWFDCSLFFLQSLGCFLERGHLKILWGSSSFSAPVCDFVMTFDSHIQVLFLLSWGKQLLSFSVRYQNAPLCLIIKDTAQY